MYDNRNSQSKPNWERWIGLMSGRPWVCPHQSCSSDQCAFEANVSVFPVIWFRSWSSLLSSLYGCFLDVTTPEDVLQLLKGIQSTMTRLQPILNKPHNDTAGPNLPHQLLFHRAAPITLHYLLVQTRLCQNHVPVPWFLFYTHDPTCILWQLHYFRRTYYCGGPGMQNDRQIFPAI